MNVELNAVKREVTGKKVKLLRLDGKTPAVVYGPGVDEPMAITLNSREATKALRGISPSTIVTIKIDGEEVDTLIRDIKYQIIRAGLLHVDFLALVKGAAVRTMVNLEIIGVAPAIAAFGALLNTGLDSIEIEAKPKDLPEVIRVDVSSLENISDGIYVKDLNLPPGVEVLSDPEAMVAFASAPSAEEEEEVVEDEDDIAEFSAEPEVIEKGYGEEADEE